MDKRNSHTDHTHKEHFFEEIRSIVTNLVSKENSSSSLHNAVNFPVQKIENDIISHTKATFMAFVDAVIPFTLGALDLRIDDYIKWTLDRYVSIQGEWEMKTLSLSVQTARMLDIAATQLVTIGTVKAPFDFSTYPDGGVFASLSHDDRFEAIRLLENLQVDLESLPPPYRNNAGLVQNVVTSLHQMVMFGYYSEWFSLGPTRLAYPEDHRFERQRFIWDRLNYPGPSFGYRAIRGFLVDKFLE